MKQHSEIRKNIAKYLAILLLLFALITLSLSSHFSECNTKEICVACQTLSHPVLKTSLQLSLPLLAGFLVLLVYDSPQKFYSVLSLPENRAPPFISI